MDKLVTLIDQPNWKIILYDLVKSNEIDIWNVNLIELTDLYLEKIRNLQQNNLLIPANALLAAAILLKLKTYSLKLSTISNDEEELKLLSEEDFMAISGSIDLNTPTRLKEGQVSLDELIDIIDVMINKPTKKNIEKRIKEVKEFKFILPRKTQEITDRINKLLDVINSYKDSENLVLFSNMTKGQDPSKMIDNYFIPMLFLVQDQKIDAWQEEFFKEIFIKTL
ncbi:MAG: segregation/condensation protein A [Candidatus ainarchaeum sp.]|nr:segregation/condensation protein A [Candidatus ainarchaeum sp.]